MELADREGIEQLSMRRLAQSLDVEAMSLYYYFEKKSELLDAMVDAVYAEMELPTGPDWRSALRSAAIDAHHTLLRHAWACSLIMMPRSDASVSTARFIWMNSVLGALRDAGFSPELIDHGYHALDSHIVGFTLWVLPYLQITQEQGAAFAQKFLTYEPIQQLPDLLDHIRYHLAEHTDDDTSSFDFALDLLLDGLERLRDG
jgi:AcrR family transcriptional regulator